VAAAAVPGRVKERVHDAVPVLCAPDGGSVVGTIVVGANVGVGVVGANVGVDFGGGSAVGASVGVAAAHTIRIGFAAAPALVAPLRRGIPSTPTGPVWCAMGTPWFAREPLEDPHASSGTRGVPRHTLKVPIACPVEYNVHRLKYLRERRTVPVEYPARVPPERPYRPFIPLRTPLKYPLEYP
jgi:hypothetical protein